jgi:hypothetical protein
VTTDDISSSSSSYKDSPLSLFLWRLLHSAVKREKKKKSPFWLVGFFYSGILFLSCVNAKENNNKTRRRKQKESDATHTQRCRLSSAHGCSCALSPLYEIEEEAKGHYPNSFENDI